jgi:SAM-dependent methyltransferase
MTRNVDEKTAGGFGREWSTFTQSDRELTAEQRMRLFADYFAIFPWEALPAQGGTGIDVGCGSGRWAALVAPRVAHLHLLDVSAEALDVARANLANAANVSFHLARRHPAARRIARFRLFARGPASRAGHRARHPRHRPQAPAGRTLSRLSLLCLRQPPDLVSHDLAGERGGARDPEPIALFSADCRQPADRNAGLLAAFASRPHPRRRRHVAGVLALAYYRDKSFYVLRTDAFDRFCTRLEQRFTRAEIETMLRDAGFEDIRFSPTMPFWCAVAFKKG